MSEDSNLLNKVENISNLNSDNVLKVKLWYDSHEQSILYEVYKYKHLGHSHILLTCDIVSDYYSVDTLGEPSHPHLREIHRNFGDLTRYDAALKNKESIFLYLYDSRLNVNIPMIITQ